MARYRAAANNDALASSSSAAAPTEDLNEYARRPTKRRQDSSADQPPKAVRVREGEITYAMEAAANEEKLKTTREPGEPIGDRRAEASTLRRFGPAGTLRGQD